MWGGACIDASGMQAHACSNLNQLIVENVDDLRNTLGGCLEGNGETSVGGDSNGIKGGEMLVKPTLCNAFSRAKKIVYMTGQSGAWHT